MTLTIVTKNSTVDVGLSAKCVCGFATMADQEAMENVRNLYQFKGNLIDSSN